MMFALVLERDPLRWQDLPSALETWVQDVGGFAAAALAIWIVARWFQRGSAAPTLPRSAWLSALFRLAVVGVVVGYGALIVLKIPDFVASASEAAKPSTELFQAIRKWCLFVGGVSAIAAAALPLLSDLARMRWRRIWALARLSFKEAVRRRVLWAFSALILVFLFASWFIPYKPENQVRNYVVVVYWAMTPLLLVTAGLLTAFSIPADVRSQTIHTIVTKPVERFEIVLGRFLGFMMLMTLVLLAMTGVSLLYLFREIDPDARFESMKARVPLYGELRFRGKDPKFEGANVGREWQYRRYVSGGPTSSQRAVWVYTTLPRDLATHSEPTVKCEFSFDIFRTYKGKEEGKGVMCSFEFRTRHWDEKRTTEYEQERERERTQTDPDRLNNQLAEKYGVFEVRSKEVVDYHTQSIQVPTALFKNALAADGSRPASRQGEEPALLEVRVKCEDGGQYLGVAKYDLYILDREEPFAWNFVKGAIGLWLRICIVVGVAVACSTYLSGVIAFMTAMFIYVVGFFLDYVRSLADNTIVGGGPMESFFRLVNKENPLTPLEANPVTHLALGTDVAYRWLLSRFLDIIPDIDRFDWTNYVAEGFNIGVSDTLFLSVLMLAGYLIPWALVGYYLIKTREIATW
jgi:ABC-type transport system involved in multi-copper enzyme maturation permease subunit